MDKKILVCCPGGRATGGPELLHQLVYELRRQGKRAYICYYPFDRVFDVVEAYRHYEVPQAPLSDTRGNIVVFPEIATHYAKRIASAEVAIWWLSVDNYFGLIRESRLLDAMRYLYGLVRGRQGIGRMRRYRHFAQSHYAKLFLERRGLRAEMLTDYLGRQHLAAPSDGSRRDDIIVYNPKKGAKRTARLIAENPDLDFVPIQGMSAAEVRNLLERAKIYIDFGHHPGKDRVPREAAMAGCCVITGRRGSARYDEDLSIPGKYKLSDESDGYLMSFRPIVENIMANFESASKEFEAYRNCIREEHELFCQQVGTVFSEW